MTQTELNRMRRHAANEKKRQAKAAAAAAAAESSHPKQQVAKVQQAASDSFDQSELETVKKRVCIYNPTKFKTMPCNEFMKKKVCPRGDDCHFAHGKEELRSQDMPIDDYLVGHKARNQHIYYFIPRKKMQEVDSRASSPSSVSHNQHYPAEAGRGRGRGRGRGIDRVRSPNKKQQDAARHNNSSAN